MTRLQNRLAAAALGVVLGAASFAHGATAAAQDGGVILLEEETVEGQIEKPEAFYILSPTNLEYESLSPTESFLDALYKTVEEDPF